MPHEVIMPALGMAQETGLIVAWHKSPGDAISAGDVLFEVETDKATMEVEAQADGFLSQIRAHAGDDVPVGDVIALIGDSTEAVHTDETPIGDGRAPAEALRVEGSEVIMPALGMAQDTGLIVAWHKAPGDAVASGDVLFEVETDKSTMEVEAGHDGYVAALFAEPGEEAPVGHVIAVISADKPDNPIQSSLAGTTAPAPTPVPAPAPVTQAPQKVEKRAVPAQASQKVAAQRGGPVLASPKARRLALEQGLDLGRLAAAGYPQPYHAADLDTLRALPADRPAPGGPAAFHLTASVPQTGFADFQAWLADTTDVQPGAVWAAFAAASLRAAGTAVSVIVRLDQLMTGRAAFYIDPDLGLLSAAAPGDEAAPSLILRDLTASRITGGNPGVDVAPVLSVARDGDEYALTLNFVSGQLEADAAIALIDGFAARLEDPLRHLL